MSKRYVVPISVGYVKDWGVWEGIRELVQNAYDQRDVAGGDAWVDYNEGNGRLVVGTETGKLERRTLLLGETTKSEQGLRGKFGEGYKLAMLALTRAGKFVVVHQEGEQWHAKLEADPDYDGAQVLVVEVEDSDDGVKGVRFVVSGVTREEWLMVQGNMIPTGPESILEGQDGRVFVGGLYVSSPKGFKRGYGFKAGSIALNRDRNMVADFDLSYQTSRLWNLTGGPESYELLKQDAPDVKYVQSYYGYGGYSPMASDVGSTWQRLNGDAVPVADQDEIKKVAAAGKKWVLVPKVLRDVVHAMVKFVIPSAARPVEKLRDFRGRVLGKLTGPELDELDAIISVLDAEENGGDQRA